MHTRTGTHLLVARLHPLGKFLDGHAVLAVAHARPDGGFGGTRPTCVGHEPALRADMSAAPALHAWQFCAEHC